ncbi:hypothetical protein F5B22DRAFT_207770 [Xylaria bambusicola]|uniref:uncharacterized protein n=1 Tax=Xylaria bambusicola TaxID=326684 RepID=UPI00200744B6|nr:uncharacterized protein F5B22DRAFT_207770 [Xylaria bambusicola]KAI0514903.1 hypothetical protein F5B22DRAFT_207770 [Xylaria bambusicola]
MPPKKRNLTESETPRSGSRRHSTRLSSAGKKSSYFENDVDDSDSDGPPRKASKTSTNLSCSKRKSQVNLSDDEDQYENEDIDDDNGDSDVFNEDEDSATPPPPKSGAGKRGRGRPPKNSTVQLQKAASQTKVVKSGSTVKRRGPPANAPTPPNTKRQGQVTRSGNEDEDDAELDDDDDDEPQVTFTPLPKLRDTDGIDYEDTKVHPNTLLFLGDLKANNKRSWLKMHDPEYRRSLKDWESFVETLTDKIIEADETIPELPIKDVIFRIYRDIRFSKDPTPYKPHYSAAWSRTGRKGPYACYYVHVEPGRCLVGGGLWHPEAQALAKLRASVDERPHRIRQVLTDPGFVRTFLPSAVGKKEDKILKAFADKNQENALKTRPKGFIPDHRDIHLLKLRNYTVGCQISDEDLHSDNAQDKIMEIIRAMVPFITFLNNVVMPDPGVDSDSDENEEEGDDNDGNNDDEEEEEEE